MKIGILGAGAYGLALACAFSKNKNKIVMWSKFKEEIDGLVSTRSTEKLPGINVPEGIEFTCNMEECIKDANIIVIAVPVGVARATIEEMKSYYNSKQCICIASKGIEQRTNMFTTDIVLDKIHTKLIAVISGPSFAIDVARGVPTGLSLGCKSKYTIQVIKKALQNNSIKLRETRDILGIEICGSIKNVIAIAAGMINGMGLPESTLAFLITESIHDIKYLINQLGGSKKTILSFAGVGDLFLTCTSTKSRNFSLGKMYGEKKSKEEIGAYVQHTTIEGLYTLKSINSLVNKKRIKLPVIDIIYSIIFKNENCEKLKKFLINKD